MFGIGILNVVLITQNTYDITKCKKGFIIAILTFAIMIKIICLAALTGQKQLLFAHKS